MNGINNDNSFNSMDMGFTSIVQQLAVLNETTKKIEKTTKNILERIKDTFNSTNNIVQTTFGNFSNSLINSYENNFKVNLDILDTLKRIHENQKKFITKFFHKDINQKDNVSENLLNPNTNSNQKNTFEFIFKDIKIKDAQKYSELIQKTIDFVNTKEDKYKKSLKFFTDLNKVFETLGKSLPKAAGGLALFAAGLFLLSLSTFSSIVKLALILPALGFGIGMFILTIVKSVSLMKDDWVGLFKIFMILWALPGLFLNMGKGILYMSIGLIVFNYVGYESLIKLSLGLFALGVVFAKVFTKDKINFLTIVAVMGFIYLITHTLIRMSDISWENTFKLITFFLGLGTALRFVGFDKIDKLNFFSILSVGIIVIVASLIDFKKITFENVINFNLFLLGLGFALNRIKTDGLLFKVIAFGISLLTIALIDASKLEFTKIIQYIFIIGLLGIVINKFILGDAKQINISVKNIGNNNNNGNTKGDTNKPSVASFAWGIVLLTGALMLLKIVEWSSVWKLLGFVTGLGIIIGLFFKMKKQYFPDSIEPLLGSVNPDTKEGEVKEKIMHPFIAFALGLSAIILALSTTSYLEWSTVWRLLAFIGGLGIIMMIFFKKENKFSGLTGLSFGMGLMLLILDALSEIEWEHVFNFTLFLLSLGGLLELLRYVNIKKMLVLTFILATFTLILYLIGTTFNEAMWINIGLFVLSVAIMGGLIFLLSNFVSQIIPGIIAAGGIAIVIGLLGLAMQEVAKVELTSEFWEFLGAFLMLTTLIGILGIFVINPVVAFVLGAGLIAVGAISVVIGLFGKGMQEVSKYKHNQNTIENFKNGIQKIMEAFNSFSIKDVLRAKIKAIILRGFLLSNVLITRYLNLVIDSLPNIDLSDKINNLTNMLSKLVIGFNDNMSGMKLLKSSLKIVPVLTIMTTIFLGTLILKRISNLEIQENKIIEFTNLFSFFIMKTANTFKKHAGLLRESQPGIKAISGLVNTTKGLADIVHNISNLNFYEYKVVNGKLVLDNVRKLNKSDFTNVGNSLALLIKSLIEPIKNIGEGTSVWRLGNITIPNPFKNNKFLDGLNNIKKIGDSFKPLVDSISTFNKTGLFDETKNAYFINGLGNIIQTYKNIFSTINEININNADDVIDKIADFNDLFSNFNTNPLKEINDLFDKFIEKLTDDSKWNKINKNLELLHKNMDKTVKSINSLNIEKAAALENNLKIMSDKSNSENIREIIDKFVEMFSLITNNQYQSNMILQDSVNTFSNSAESFRNSLDDNFKQKNEKGLRIFENIQNGNQSIDFSKLPEEQRKILEEINQNNGFLGIGGDNVINNKDISKILKSNNDVNNTLKKLITVLSQMK